MKSWEKWSPMERCWDCSGFKLTRWWFQTYVSWSIPPTHPKRPQMKGIPSVGAWNSRDMLEIYFLYESLFGRFSHVKIHWGERSYPTCWNGSLGCKKIWLPHLLVLFLWRLAVSNPESGIMFHVMFCIFTHRNPWSWYVDSMDLPTWEP